MTLQIGWRGELVDVKGNLPVVGEKAPDFTLTADDLTEITLADFAGQNLVLNIFRGDNCQDVVDLLKPIFCPRQQHIQECLPRTFYFDDPESTYHTHVYGDDSNSLAMYSLLSFIPINLG